jgi:hypothetical protein
MESVKTSEPFQMMQITVDGVMQAQLENAINPLEVRDTSGRLLGHFVPTLSAPKSGRGGPTITHEEMDRREKAGGGRPLAAIIADLERRK